MTILRVDKHHHYKWQNDTVATFVVRARKATTPTDSWSNATIGCYWHVDSFHPVRLHSWSQPTNCLSCQSCNLAIPYTDSDWEDRSKTGPFRHWRDWFVSIV